jgi:Flp pilus assembly protein TadG
MKGKMIHATSKAHLKRDKQKGQSIVEISLITPILLIALYIPADFGLAFYMTHLSQNAAREGARIGSGLASPFGSSEAVTVKNAVVTVKFYSGTTCMQFVEVAAQIRYNFFLYQLMRLFGATAPDSVPITRTTQIRYNFQPYTYTTPCATVDTYGPYSS